MYNTEEQNLMEQSFSAPENEPQVTLGPAAGFPGVGAPGMPGVPPVMPPILQNGPKYPQGAGTHQPPFKTIPHRPQRPQQPPQSLSKKRTRR
jgi:hypothetical protein